MLSIELGIYVNGIGDARFSDTVLVTKTGYKVLTPFELEKSV